VAFDDESFDRKHNIILFALVLQFLGKYSGSDFKLDGDEYKILHETDLLVIPIQEDYLRLVHPTPALKSKLISSSRILAHADLDILSQTLV